MQTELVEETNDETLAAGATVFTVEDARDLVQLFAKVTSSKNVDDFLNGFTDDCIVRYGEFPEMRGKEVFRPFVEQMFSDRLKNFRCEKSLRSLSGNVIGGTWESTWTDAESGKKRAGRGFEFWIMRDRQIARWDAGFNFWTVK